MTTMSRHLNFGLKATNRWVSERAPPNPGIYLPPIAGTGALAIMFERLR
jgi:hypothetical protein